VGEWVGEGIVYRNQKISGAESCCRGWVGGWPGWASNKGSTSMLILCKCVEIRCTRIRSVIYLKNKLWRGLYILHSSTPLLTHSLTPQFLTRGLYIPLWNEIFRYPSVYIPPQYPFSGEIIYMRVHHRVKKRQKYIHNFI